MVSELRRQFNATFTPDRYAALCREMNSTYRWPVDFRISETPLFLPAELSCTLIDAAHDVLRQAVSPEYLLRASSAIPEKRWNVPRQTDHPSFVQIDFALCRDDAGGVLPQLIELQGFASLFCYQAFLDRMMRKHYVIPSELSPYFNGLDEDSYLRLLRDVIVGEADPERTVLLEIQPELQKTRIDFACTEAYLGIRPVCVTSIRARGSKLYYQRPDGREIPIDRIYNRVIFDELERKQIRPRFEYREPYDVEWVGHPNWYFTISKYTLPFLGGKFCPPCTLVSDAEMCADDLQNYVLKPLYSFAGAGVEMEVTRQRLDALPGKERYILQKKVEYAPLVETPDGFAKAEIRMMFVWKDSPVLVNNLVRMSKGKMMGVDFNKDKTWIGSSLAYHPPL
jgi:hypothetical protein